MRCLKGRRGLINRHIAIAAPNGGAVKRTSEAAPTPMPQAKSQVRSSVSQYRSNVSSVTNMAKMKRGFDIARECRYTNCGERMMIALAIAAYAYLFVALASKYHIRTEDHTSEIQKLMSK